MNDVENVVMALMKSHREEVLQRKGIAFGKKAAAMQFSGRKGHGGNPKLAERHFTRHQLEVLLAAAFIAGANLGE